jgi:hypothetical protein
VYKQAAKWHKGSTMKNKLLLTIPLLLLLMFLMTQPGKSQSTTDPTPTLTVEVAAEMEAVPSDCGILAEEMTIDPMITHAIGTWPIWVALPNEAGSTKGILSMPNKHYQENPQLEGWWSTKVAWFIDPSYTGEVRLQGFNVDDNSPIYFEFDELTTLAAINPAEPGGFADGLEAWAFFPSYMWVSKAGCYRLQAEWDGGLWQQIIAVGRSEA